MKTKIFRDILIIATLKSIPDLKRNPSTIVLISVISGIPLFFMIIFSAQIGTGIIGAMVSTVGFIGLNSAIQDMTWDRYLKIREIVVAMPVHPISYAMGVALAPLIVSIPGLLLFMAIALWLGILTLQSLIWSIAILIVCWATLSSLGFFISTNLRRANVYTLSNLSNILGLLLSFLPPVYYPEEILGNFSWISIIFPTSNSASLIRIYSGSLIATTQIIIVRWVVLIITMIIFAIITIKESKWREP